MIYNNLTLSQADTTFIDFNLTILKNRGKKPTFKNEEMIIIKK